MDDATSQARPARSLPPAGRDAVTASQAGPGQARLDEIGRALGLMSYVSGSGPRRSAPHPSHVAAPQRCQACGHEKWTSSRCAICALFGSQR